MLCNKQPQSLAAFNFELLFLSFMGLCCGLAEALLGTADLVLGYGLVFWFARAAIKIPQTWWLKKQECIFSQFWRLEVQDQELAGLVSSEVSLLSL